MRFNLDFIMLTPKGEQQTKDDKVTPFTMRDIFEFLVVNDYKEDVGMTPEQKVKRYRLKQKVMGNKESIIDFSDDEKAMIKELANRALTVDAYGQFFDYFEGAGLASSFHPSDLNEVKA